MCVCARAWIGSIEAEVWAISVVQKWIFPTLALSACISFNRRLFHTMHLKSVNIPDIVRFACPLDPLCHPAYSYHVLYIDICMSECASLGFLIHVRILCKIHWPNTSIQLTECDLLKLQWTHDELAFISKFYLHSIAVMWWYREYKCSLSLSQSHSQSKSHMTNRFHPCVMKFLTYFGMVCNVTGMMCAVCSFHEIQFGWSLLSSTRTIN